MTDNETGRGSAKGVPFITEGGLLKSYSTVETAGRTNAGGYCRGNWPNSQKSKEEVANNVARKRREEQNKKTGKSFCQGKGRKLYSLSQKKGEKKESPTFP